MSLILNNNRIEIVIPNSEASICAQHEGIKDRTVGSYYMSDIYNDVYNFLNHLKGNYYIDMLRTYKNMKELYDYIEEKEKFQLFKNALVDQLTIMNDLSIELNKETLYKIDPPTVNENYKYLKFDRNDQIVKYFEDLLLGDLTSIIIRKLSNDTFIIYGETVEEYKEKLENNFNL